MVNWGIFNTVLPPMGVKVNLAKHRAVMDKFRESGSRADLPSFVAPAKDSLKVAYLLIIKAV